MINVGLNNIHSEVPKKITKRSKNLNKVTSINTTNTPQVKKKPSK
jgi:hypothetical protein